VARIDRNQLRTNQSLTLLAVATSLLLQHPAPMAAMALALLLGLVGPDPLAGARKLLRVPDHPIREDARPHRFARGLAGGMLATSTLLWSLGHALPAALLALAVGALAALSLGSGFCLGCFLYYQLKLLPHRLRQN